MLPKESRPLTTALGPGTVLRCSPDAPRRWGEVISVYQEPELTREADLWPSRLGSPPVPSETRSGFWSGQAVVVEPVDIPVDFSDKRYSVV